MIQTLFGFVKKELSQSLRDPRMKVVLFITPVIQLCLFGYAISTEIKNIRIASTFQANDYVLRDIYENSVYSEWFTPATSKNSDPYYLLSTNKADVVLTPPPGGFTKNLGRADAKLQVAINSANVIKGQSIDGYLQNIIQKVIERALEIEFTSNPIKISQRVLFNPDLNTALFMVPGTMCLIMVTTSMVLTGMSIVREKEMGTFEMLISAPVNSFEIICGKTVPYIILGIVNFPLILLIAHFVFSVPVRGSILMLLLASFVFICMAVFMGTFVSTFCKNQQQAVLAVFLFLFPMIMLSGLMFPIENMPTLLQYVAYIDPLYHYIGLLRNIMLKGGGTSYILNHVTILLVMAVVTITISLHRLRLTLN